MQARRRNRIGSGRRTRAVRSGFVVLAAALAVPLALALAPAAQADAFDRAVAEIDEALEKNPHGASPESLRSCRSMRKTALLLRKLGHMERAIRRINACRRLLGLDPLDSRSMREWKHGWFG